ncbi:serine hydrolase domain-containing protein [Parvibaculum sp.]|uniref:serine hydrolase domain-containing protein n=3 Tax=Parvibaculum sp. TaxID=2024848 RepID=UPI001B119D64|nr:serine hydrolase domain-containing protein [Parvibaculum sp.]MBO6677316.1 beta-lactamase family protein [Parvibaculum sp.]MBO6686536.1 beta-lactamase family protein [Parvibaculum sp.]MBO6905901.1 beta-lactamase family protein [Parvibaculum sp.]
MEKLSRETKAGALHGTYDTKFKPVVDAIVENFETRDEVGANVAITLEGKPVLDIWGGKKARDGDAWDKDTVSIVFSCTKGATALCAHMLADRGKLDLDAKVADYWPEYAKNGKEETLVSMMLDHSAGMPHVRTPLKDSGYCDYDYMVKLLESEEPFWKPGTRNGYHGVTFAWTVGELVHRASGKRLGQFFADEVAKPLGLDFHIGTPEEVEPRIAAMIFADPDPAAANSKFTQALMNDPSSPAHLFLLNSGGMDFNSRACHAAEIGSANGITNGRGLAAMYQPLANGGGNLVGKDTLARMGRVAMATHEDATLLIPSRFALGFMKSMDNRVLANEPNSSCILGDAAFGHVGMGGSIGFADPEAHMSFGYNMNRMGAGILLNDRGQALVDAAYTALGYRSNASGVWAL